MKNSGLDIVHKALYAPIWVLQLFTTAKSFRDNPILGSRRLNKWGLHVARLVVAERIMRLRMAWLGLGVAKADRAQYRQNGFIIKENFISADVFPQIEAEIRAFKGDTRACQQGDTQNQRTLLDPDTLAQLPVTRAWLENDAQLRRLLRYSAGHTRMPFLHIEQVHNGIKKQAPDPQKNLHSDTFHPNMKFWLFLDDVDERNGPFTYVPGSQRLDKKRIRWEYAMSQRAQNHPDLYTGRGSFRFSSDDLKALGLPAARALKVPKNTLVIANTFGIHGRGQAAAHSTRLSIWGMSRTNPFIPIPGTGLRIFDRLQYHAFLYVRHWQDTQAAKRGKKAAWYRID